MPLIYAALVKKLHLPVFRRGTFMTNAKRFTLKHSVLAVLFMGNAAYAAPACAQMFGSKKTSPVEKVEADAPHVEVKTSIDSDKLTKLARSNAPQSWAWFKVNADNYLPKSLFKFQGMIDGDPHNGNYGPVVVNGKVKWKSLDYDDAGTGPFILDYAKLLIAIKAVDSVKKVKASTLMNLYLRGLRGEAFDAPPIISEFLNMSAAEFRNLEVKKAGKFSVGDRLLNDGEKSTKITDKKLHNLIMETFRRSLPEGSEILDVGGREKVGGGSGSVDGEGGVLRFIGLVKGKDGRNSLYELKQDSDSGVGNYQTQTVTLQEVLNFNVLGKNSNDTNFQEVHINIDGDKTFVLRPKPLYFYDYANKAKTNSQFAEFEALSMYNAWYKGYMHGQQKGAKEYLKALEADTDGKIMDGLKDMTWGYLEFLQTFLPK